MKLKNVNFENMSDLGYVLRRPMDNIKFPGANEMVKIMENVEQKITVHLYSVWGARKRKRLQDFDNDVKAQLYIAIDNDRIYAGRGSGTGSGTREEHNRFIDAFLSRPDLQKDVPTAILITGWGKHLGYYFYEHYAYQDNVIGFNWDINSDISIRDALKEANLPRSYTDYSINKSIFRNTTIFFENKGEKVLVYKALREDIVTRKFDKTIAKMRENP